MNNFLLQLIEHITLQELRKFNVRELDSVPVHPKFPRALIDYVKTHTNLKKLGEGTARIVFLYDSKSVLKIAKNQKGLAQNEAELDAYTNPKLKPIFAKIYAYGRENRWLLSELVRELTGGIEFEQLTGLNYSSFRIYIQPGYGGFDKRINWLEKNKDNVFLKSILNAIEVGKILPGDIVLSHLGKTSDGRVVLLDYGYNEEVRQNYYS